jgi:hypothetical protein
MPVWMLLAAPAFGSDTATPATSVETPDDFNRQIYYRNKLEFSFEAGWLPWNTPFVFNPLMGDVWDRTPLDYTLVPLTLSLRWHLDDIGGPWIFRGNTDLTFSGTYTAIPQGPESVYAGFMTGIRYNFVQSGWRTAPYLEGRVGLGYTDSKGRQGVHYAQGEDFTFNFIMGGGIRYNFDPVYSMSLGIAYMHISNLYLSEPKSNNYGINVFGPMLGVNVGF